MKYTFVPLVILKIVFARGQGLPKYFMQELFERSLITQFILSKEKVMLKGLKSEIGAHHHGTSIPWHKIHIYWSRVCRLKYRINISRIGLRLVIVWWFVLSYCCSNHLNTDDYRLHILWYCWLGLNMEHPAQDFSITLIMGILVNAQLVPVDSVPCPESHKGRSVEWL